MYSSVQALAVLLIIRHFGAQTWLLGLISMVLCYSTIALEKYLTGSSKRAHDIWSRVVVNGVLIITASKGLRAMIPDPDWTSFLIDAMIPICVGVFMGLWDFAVMQRQAAQP